MDLSTAGERLSIKQTAKLYDVTIDTLYYYEKLGLVVPQRNEANGYRIYAGEDFWRLNIIQTMQGMDFSLGQVKRYLDSHTLQTNITLLREELNTLNEMLGRLRDRQKGVESTLVRYSQALLDYPGEEVQELLLPERPCLMVCDSLGSEYNIPLLCAQKATEAGVSLNVFHMLPMFTTTTAVNGEGTFDGKSCLLFSETPTGFEDCSLPEGLYLSTTFSGSAERTPEIYRRQCSYMNEHGMEALGDPVEFWTVNEYVSDNDAEYIHTFQQRVRRLDG